MHKKTIIMAKKKSNTPTPLKCVPASLSYILIFVVFLIPSLLLAEQPTDKPLKGKEIRSIAGKVATIFADKYILKNDGGKISRLISRNIETGVYDKLKNGRDLARRLQADARSINGDRHINIYFSPATIQDNNRESAQKKKTEDQQRRARIKNFGFEETRILAGNIGYLKLNGFNGSQQAFYTATAAMQFLSNCYAVIIDLRWNPGGDSRMVQYISSYFLGNEPQILDVFHFRENNRTEQMWTLPYVPGRKLYKTDLYILTSALTFSAAEGLAYDLKALQRAIIVGETTMGGGHAVEEVAVEDKFLVLVPHVFSKNPVTQTNFQGVGVKPDIPVVREHALLKAHILALRKLIDTEKDASVKKVLEWSLHGLNEKPVILSESKKESLVGTFGPYKIVHHEGNLYFFFGPGKLRMVPIREDYFRLENYDALRIKTYHHNGSITGIEVHERSGTVNHYPITAR